jgi:hypothetical protein
MESRRCARQKVSEIIEYLDTGKVLAKDAEDEDIMFARPGPTVEYWEGEVESSDSPRD